MSDIIFYKTKSIMKIIYVIYFILIKIYIFGFSLHFLDNSIVLISFALLSLLLFFYDVYKNSISDKYKIEIFLSFAFIILAIISTYVNVNRIPLVTLSFNFVMFLLLFYNNSNTPRDIIEKEKSLISKIVFYVISISTAISLVFALIEKIFNITLFNHTSFMFGYRFYGVIGINHNPNACSHNYFIGIFLGILLITKNKERNIHIILLTILNTIALLLTNTRVTILALFALVFLVFLYYIIKTNKLKHIVTIIITLSLLLFSYFMFNYKIGVEAGDRPSIIQPNYNFENIANNITSNRYQLYKASIEMAKDSPIIGKGLNTFHENAIKKYGENSMEVYNTNEDPHCLIFSVYYYLGIVGLLIVTIYLFRIIKNVVKHLKNNVDLDNYVISGFLFGCFIISLLDYNMFIRVYFYGIIFWLYLGYLYFDLKKE